MDLKLVSWTGLVWRSGGVRRACCAVTQLCVRGCSGGCSHSASRMCDLSVFFSTHTEPRRFAGRSSSIMDEKLSFFPPSLSLPGTWPFPDYFCGLSSHCDILIKDKAIFSVLGKRYPPESGRIIYTNSSLPGEEFRPDASPPAEQPPAPCVVVRLLAHQGPRLTWTSNP